MAMKARSCCWIWSACTVWQNCLSPSSAKRLIERRDDDCLFEAVIDERTVASAFADHAAAVRSITVDDDEMRVVVELPQDTDVRRFVETVHARYPDAELVVRRDRERSKQLSADVWDNLEDELTERQLEVLQVAYHSGFFDSPRRSTGACWCRR